MNITGRPNRCFALFFLCIVLFPVSLAARQSPGSRELYEAGRSYLSADNPYQAIDSFRSSLRLNPSYVEARLGMAEALFLLGEYEEASAELERARPYAKGLRELVLLEARILMALGNYESSVSLYNSLLDKRPHDAEANRGLAEIYALNGQKDLAEQAYGRSLQYLPGDRRALLQLVLLHDSRRQRQKAESALSEVLRLFPDNLTVRLQAAEHYALYGDWKAALDQLARAKSMAPVPGNFDPRYRRVQMLDASLSLRRGDPAAALKALENLPAVDEPDSLFLLARIHRDLGSEEQAQRYLDILAKTVVNDEIVRIFREDPLVKSSSGFESYRRDAASWHLEQGRRYENEFFYDRAFREYGRAKVIDKFSADAWMAYVDLIRKKGFPSKYTDSLNVALENISTENPQRPKLERRRELLEHSGSSGLPEAWDIVDPWAHQPLSWNVSVYYLEDAQALPYHNGSAPVLSSYFASELDADSDVSVIGDTKNSLPEVTSVADFAEASRKARGSSDYFVMLGFAETERSFHGKAEIFLARTGESLGEYNEIRTGLGRVSDTLNRLALSTAAAIPVRSSILAVRGNKVLLDRGTWHGIDAEKEWLVLRKGSGRPALTEGGISYAPRDVLGTLTILESSESLTEAEFKKTGDFDFLTTADEAFLLTVPEFSENEFSSPDPAFRTRLLSIP